jgi:hypothetical protein
MSAPVEGGSGLAADQPAQRVSGNGAPPPRIEPAGLAAEELGDVRPRGEEALVEIVVVGDLANQARAHCHRGRRSRRIPSL